LLDGKGHEISVFIGNAESRFMTGLAMLFGALWKSGRYDVREYYMLAREIERRAGGHL
jgi:hypothetical protein